MPNRGFKPQGTAINPVQRVMFSGQNMADKISERQKTGKTWEEFKLMVKQKEEGKAENIFARETERFQGDLKSARDDKRRAQELKDLNKLRAARGLKVKKKDKKDKKKKDKKKKDKKRKKKKKKKEDSSSSSESDSDTDAQRTKAARESDAGWRISSFLKNDKN
eukprot:GEMP01074819.1.p1 GENE.GEMP01074819.1~~GEMP01074819.1.p1  ORF type:complete len:164 (+),score=44.21 GEMP01074819.1:156-647(+)